MLLTDCCNLTPKPDLKICAEGPQSRPPCRRHLETIHHLKFGHLLGSGSFSLNSSHKVRFWELVVSAGFSCKWTPSSVNVYYLSDLTSCILFRNVRLPECWGMTLILFKRSDLGSDVNTTDLAYVLSMLIRSHFDTFCWWSVDQIDGSLHPQPRMAMVTQRSLDYWLPWLPYLTLLPVRCNLRSRQWLNGLL